jgi:MazG family protein
MEESYEVLEAIDDLATVDRMLNPDDGGGGEGVVSVEAEERAVAHLEEELGDLLFQVYFHSTLAAESGRFTLADVARGVHDKLVGRHPHVFGGVNAATADQVAANWEASKKTEKNRKSVTEGIPAALPALALAAKLQRKGIAVGMELPGLDEEANHLAIGMTEVAGAAGLAGAADRTGPSGTASPSGTTHEERIGDLLFSLVNVARALGVDPESALRAKAAAFRASVEALG